MGHREFICDTERKKMLEERMFVPIKTITEAFPQRKSCACIEETTNVFRYSNRDTLEYLLTE